MSSPLLLKQQYFFPCVNTGQFLLNCKCLLIDWTVYFDLLAWWLWLVACGLWLVALAVLPPLHPYFSALLSSLSERRLESRDRLVPGAPWKNSDPWMKIWHLGPLDLLGFLENLHKTQNTVVVLFSFVIDCTCVAATKISNVWIDSWLHWYCLTVEL